MNYRPEIDGLRALAVVPVILFHARLQSFAGGFVGVDVFFVISGYLITSIIQSDLEKGRFSVVNFYERRARRILPALFLVVACSLPAAWIWLLPHDMNSFSQSVAAVSVFASNILFLHQSAYFDTTDVKPLLHTWSLAVEEQFYVLFPLLLFLIWRFARKWLIPAFVVVALSSFLLADWGSMRNPGATFYLLPTRAWELLLGALAALYLANAERRNDESPMAGWLSAAGLSLIVYAIWSLDESTPFPGRYALLPAVGTALVILFASPRTVVGKLLGSRWLVAIGLVSYSAYLWHQPILSFAREASNAPLSPITLALLIVLCLALSWASWKYVENPFRQKSSFSRRQIFTFAGIGSLALLTLGLIGHATHGFEARLTPRERVLLDYLAFDMETNYWKDSCYLVPEANVDAFFENCSAPAAGGDLLWGDSHAAALAYGLKTYSRDIVQYAGTGCPPLLDTTIVKRPRCRKFNDYIRAEIARIRPRRIFMHANWSRYLHVLSRDAVRHTLETVHAISPESRIVLIGSVPHWYRRLPKLILHERSGLDDEYYLPNQEIDRLRIRDRVLRDAIAGTQVAFVAPVEEMCATNRCLATIRYEGKVMPTTWDEGHLTTGASVFLASRIMERVQAPSTVPGG